ncbi:MAG: methyltransferase domain-containing protein [Chitinivibrionales bacterium]|nr:methyltransferase domain-containing protein [Chitinivibrionales bacterium]
MKRTTRLPYPATTFAVRLSVGERLFLRPADTQAVLDAITDEQFDADEQLPYWAEHWPSTAVAVRYFDQHPPAPRHTVCEIGCGLGVLSWVLTRHGATVISFDIAFPGCVFAAANLTRHGAPPRVLCADWRSPPFKARFDTIVAADVLYEARWVAPVLHFVHSALADGGAAYVADPCRAHWERFLGEAETRGLNPTRVHRETLNQGKTTVEIVRLTKSKE